RLLRRRPPQARRLAHHFRERPECDPVAVGEAAAAQHCRAFHQAGAYVPGETRLADARRPDDRHEPAAALVDGSLEGFEQKSLLPITPDDWRIEPDGPLGPLVHVEQAKDRLRQPPTAD